MTNSEQNKRPIPFTVNAASLQIGKIPSPAKPISFDNLMKSIDHGYTNYITNQQDWDFNDTRDLIIKMKFALDELRSKIKN